MTLAVYLAAPYVAREEVAHYAAELASVGFRITSRWLAETHEIGEGTAGAATDLAPALVSKHAHDDLHDIDDCDILVALTAASLGALAPFGNSGGRHVELGYAIARNKRVLVVGEPENIFHRMSGVDAVPNWHAAVLRLAADLADYWQNAPRAKGRAS